MTKVFRTYVAILLLNSLAVAYSTQSPTRPGATASQASEPLTPQQTADLAEATRLSAEVVKLYKQHKYDEAFPLAKTALEIRKRVLGPEEPAVAAALINLAELYLAKRKYGDALTFYQPVLPIYEKGFGPVNDNTAIIVEILAFLRYVQGDFDEAERLYQRAVSIRESVGPERREVAKALYKLAEFYSSRTQYKKAEALFLRAIAINDKVTAEDDSERGNTIQRYICFLYESRNVNDAQKAETEFYERRKRNTSNREPTPGGVINGKAIKLPRPVYPDEARDLRLSGIVRVQVLISETGRVTEAKALCGHPALAKPSLEAAYKARFSPTKLSGMAVSVNGIILYNFEQR